MSNPSCKELYDLRTHLNIVDYKGQTGLSPLANYHNHAWGELQTKVSNSLENIYAMV